MAETHPRPPPRAAGATLTLLESATVGGKQERRDPRVAQAVHRLALAVYAAARSESPVELAEAAHASWPPCPWSALATRSPWCPLRSGDPGSACASGSPCGTFSTRGSARSKLRPGEVGHGPRPNRLTPVAVQAASLLASPPRVQP